jgi:uncharacterized integral membrane protein
MTMGKLIFIIIGYILAASVSESVSFDLAQTEWSNIWTYVYVLIGALITGTVVFLAALLSLVALKYLEKRGY